QMAHRRAIREIDRTSTIPAGIGGWWEKLTGGLNVAAGCCCSLGLISLLVFAASNIGGSLVSNRSTTVEKAEGRPLPQAPAARPAPAPAPAAPAPAAPAPARPNQ